MVDLSISGEQLLEQAMHHFGLRARAYHRIRKVARTITDLAGEDTMTPPHFSEAIQYRMHDRR